jgi:hypothetical protein
MRLYADVMARVFSWFAAAIVASAATGEVPFRSHGPFELAAAKGGAAGVSGRATKGDSVAGKPKPGGSINGGKR